MITARFLKAPPRPNFREVLNQPDQIRLRLGDSLRRSGCGQISPEETKSAIHRLHSGKVPGLDEIALEMLKAGGDVMVKHLMALLNVCWRLRQVPDEW